ASPRGSLETVSVPARSVIRKANIELIVDDVRSTFAKVQQMLRPEIGEFAEGSTLTGQDAQTRGQVTLRVAAARADDVLHELRLMGKVESESAPGDDVTDQVIDLGARLRNERQVEAEVLKPLQTRQDAPLKEILDLRDKLSSIRQTIE